MTATLLPPPPTPAIESAPESTGIQTPDILTALQLRVARRSDELARWQDSSRATDRRLWLRAEQEVFARVERAIAHLERQVPGSASIARSPAGPDLREKRRARTERRAVGRNGKPDTPAPVHSTGTAAGSSRT